MQNHSFICIILLLFFSACLFSSFVQDSVANLIGLKTTYIFGLAMFGLSMFFTVVFPSVVVLNICAAFSGLGFAVATTIPCSLLTRYHQQPDLFFRDTRPIGAFTGKNLWIRGLFNECDGGYFSLNFGLKWPARSRSLLYHWLKAKTYCYNRVD